MASASSEKKQPLSEPAPDSPISAANSPRASIETLESPATQVPASAPLPEYTEVPEPASKEAPPTASPSTTQGPTVNAPFNFPSTAPPAYEERDKIRQPIAIPQLQPNADSGFIPAYPPALLALGIPRESWLSFLDTLSAFLRATVSKQALTHAGDIAASVAAIPTQLGRDLVANAVDIGRQAGRNVRRGNIPGVVHNVVGLTLGSVGHVVGAAVSLPGRTVGAIRRKPRSPRERAEAYVAAANRDWFRQRGLRAAVLGTGELAELLGVPSGQILDSTVDEGATARQQFKGLRSYVGELQVDDKASEKAGKVVIGRSTLWLVIESL